MLDDSVLPLISKRVPATCNDFCVGDCFGWCTVFMVRWEKAEVLCQEFEH